jgi:hypothetical protein
VELDHQIKVSTVLQVHYQKQLVVVVVQPKPVTQTELHSVEMVAQFLLLVQPCFMAVVAVVEKSQLVQLEEMVVVETAQHLALVELV